MDTIAIGLIAIQLLVLLGLLYQVGILVARGDLFLKEIEELRHPGWAEEFLELQRKIAVGLASFPLTPDQHEETSGKVPGQLEESALLVAALPIYNSQPETDFHSTKVQVVRDGVTLQVLEYSPDLKDLDAVFSSPRHCLIHQGISYHEKQDWLNHCKTTEG